MCVRAESTLRLFESSAAQPGFGLSRVYKPHHFETESVPAVVCFGLRVYEFVFNTVPLQIGVNLNSECENSRFVCQPNLQVI